MDREKKITMQTVYQADSLGTAKPLENMYADVPFWREILASVEIGRAEFMSTLEDLGFGETYSMQTSAVHAWQDIEVHAFILGIVSIGRWKEIETKSYLTYASHWIDDFFDSPAKVPDPAQLLRDRHDVKCALKNTGRVGEVGFAMADRTEHPDAVFRALHRMLYGGLVQRSLNRTERRSLLEEYLVVATRSLAPVLVEEILGYHVRCTGVPTRRFWSCSPRQSGL